MLKIFLKGMASFSVRKAFGQFIPYHSGTNLDFDHPIRPKEDFIGYFAEHVITSGVYNYKLNYLSWNTEHKYWVIFLCCKRTYALNSWLDINVADQKITLRTSYIILQG